jgi:copper chaperone CopZ
MAVLASFGCRKQDIRTFTLSVPDMKNSACATVIVNALSHEQTIAADNIQVDLAGRKVTVKYDSILRAQKNLVFCVAKAGFTCNGVPANPEAVKALPAECK